MPAINPGNPRLPAVSAAAYNQRMESIPDDALVVRGGRNRPADIERGIGVHPSGVPGVSVECASGVSLEVLAEGIPHNRIGVTTVAQVRAAGGEAVRTFGRSKYHATLTGLAPEAASRLLTPTLLNPAKRTDDKT